LKLKREDKYIRTPWVGLPSGRIRKSLDSPGPPNNPTPRFKRTVDSYWYSERKYSARAQPGQLCNGLVTIWIGCRQRKLESFWSTHKLLRNPHPARELSPGILHPLQNFKVPRRRPRWQLNESEESSNHMQLWKHKARQSQRSIQEMVSQISASAAIKHAGGTQVSQRKRSGRRRQNWMLPETGAPHSARRVPITGPGSPAAKKRSKFDDGLGGSVRGAETTRV